jgi:RNase P/RNase MRP subunit p30
MQIIILQRLKEDLDAINASMREVCPELIEKTHFLSYVKDAKELISTKKKFLAKRTYKDVIVVTGSILMDDSCPKTIHKIKKWNKNAEIIVFSILPENIINNEKIRKKISVVIVKSLYGPSHDLLAKHISKRHEEKTKK